MASDPVRGLSDPPLGARGVTMAVTIMPRMRPCPVCAAPFMPVGRRRYCSTNCRARAYRRRRAAEAPPPPSPPPGGLRARSVYECPECAARYFGEQRCEVCDRFCRRVGLGGTCPYCDEPVAVCDLIDP